MEKQERGLLLVEQEETAAKITELTARIKNYGAKLTTFANAIKQYPASVKFKNAPDGLNIPAAQRTDSNSFEWADIPDKETIALTVQELVEQQKHLKDVQTQLQNKPA